MREVNRKICQLFAQKEVLADVSEFVEYVFDTATQQNAPPFTEEDVVVLSEQCCPNCGASGDQIETMMIESEQTQAEYLMDAPPDERWRCPWCGTGYPSKEEAEECCVGLKIAVCPACGYSMTTDEYDDRIVGDMGNVQQWWIVTPWLAKKLMEYGEPIIESANIWGRHSNDRDWSTDDAICHICQEIGILEGQPHDWSRYFKEEN